MAMAIRGFGEIKILAIHFEFGHSPILAIRWSGVDKPDFLFRLEWIFYNLDGQTWPLVNESSLLMKCLSLRTSKLFRYLDMALTFSGFEQLTELV